MNEIQGLDPVEEKPPRNPNIGYIVAAVVLLAVIAIATTLLITKGLPALTGEKEPTATSEARLAATQVPTFTPKPADTAAPAPSLVMSDTDTPAFEFQGAGARPGKEWTGFFGQVVDADGNPLAGVPVIIWYNDGQPFAPPVLTDSEGNYEIRLADAPRAGAWTIQLLTEDGNPASRLFTFETDENTETGIQQIQVLWRQLP